MEESGARIVETENKIVTYFVLDLFQFFEELFYYKYRPCIRVNLEIEGAETRVYKATQTRVCIEVALGKKH